MGKLREIILSAFFLSLGLILPFVTGQIPEIGSMLLPMHIPVLICGFVCGWKWGLTVGIIMPLLRSLLFGMPPILTAIGMSFELATYGTVTGLLYQKFSKKKVYVYLSLIIAMIVGRIVWGFVSVVLYGISGSSFSWQLFVSGALLHAIPGIVLQIIMVPTLIIALEKIGVIQIHDSNN